MEVLVSTTNVLTLSHACTGVISSSNAKDVQRVSNLSRIPPGVDSMLAIIAALLVATVTSSGERRVEVMLREGVGVGM
jgi:hypothetical protein